MKNTNNININETVITLQDIEETLTLGDYGDQITDYSNSAYICDVISEIADGNTSIYNGNLWDWAKDNYEYCEDAISEGLYDTSKDFDLMRLFQVGQYLQIQQELYKNITDILKWYAVNDLGIEYFDIIDEFITDENAHNYNRLDSLLDDIKAELES